MNTLLQLPITPLPVSDEPIAGLLTAYRERHDVIETLDTVQVLVVHPKPDDFPCVVHDDVNYLLIGFIWILAFMYFSVMLYLLVPTN